jgi:transposase
MRAEQATLPELPPREEGVVPEGRPQAGRAARLKKPNRQQMILRTIDVECLIPDDHPARAIWEFVGRLDLSRFRARVRSVEGGAGRPAFDPHLLVSLWVYSYIRQVASARAIERLCSHDPAYQWLTGMEVISGHTLSDFRVDHGEALADLFKQVLGVLSGEGLITLDRVMVDGTRIRARAASSEFRTRERIEHLQAAAKLVDTVNGSTEEELSLKAQRARERARREKEERLEAALAQFEALRLSNSSITRASTTDPEARIMKLADGGTAPAYNVQISTDATNSLIVGIDVTQAGSDYQQLVPAVERLEEQAGTSPEQLVVDGGYISNDNIIAMSERGIELIGPEPKRNRSRGNPQASYSSRGVSPDYETPQFQFDEALNVYVCPQGKQLSHNAKFVRAGSVHIRYKARPQDCHGCPAKRLCCPSNRWGRSIEKIEPLQELVTYRERMGTSAARAIYRTRSQIAEFPNLWLKAKYGLRQFSVRGRLKGQLEATWAAITYDIQHWIRLTWLPSLATSA